MSSPNTEACGEGASLPEIHPQIFQTSIIYKLKGPY